MKATQIAALAFTILGVFALIQALHYVAPMITMIFQQRNTFLEMVARVIPFAVLLVAGVFFIVKRNTLAHEFSAPDPETTTEFSIERLENLAFAVFGLSICLSTLPALGSAAASVIHLRAAAPRESTPFLLRSQMGYHAGALITVVAGAYLFLGAQSFGRFWRRLSTRGVAHEAQTSAPACQQCGHPVDPSDYQHDAQTRRCSKCKAELPDDLFSDSA